MMVLRDALRQWSDRLRDADSAEPEWEARLIACHLLEVEPGCLATCLNHTLVPEAARVADRLIAGRAARIPLPYLLGESHFYGLRLRCDRRALVPRPETELLVDVALQWLCGRGAVTVADVGTGSGCIALAILTNNRRVRLIATDISEEALILARENATVLGHTERITFLHGDLLAPISQAGLAEEIGALVANLPYVAESEYLAAQPELHYEPRMALVAGCTGLELITRLTQQLHTLPNLAFAAIEIGARQGPTALSLVRNALPHWHVELRQDLAGLDRIVVACKDYPEHRPQ